MKNIFNTKNKKGQLISGIIGGIVGLVILVIVSYLIIDTLMGAGIMTTGSAHYNVTNDMVSNYSAGINNVSAKIPTVLLVAAIVLLFGAIVILVQRARMTTMSAGSAL